MKINSFTNGNAIDRLESINRFVDENKKIKSTDIIDFSKLLNDAINKIDEAKKTSEKYDKMLITGEIDNIHDVMIAAQKADILFSFGMEVRNQILDAYREIMRLQL